MKNHPALAALSGLSLVLLAVGSFDAPARAASGSGAITTAEQTTETLTQALVAAVASISDSVPPGAPAIELQAASVAVSLLLPESQEAYRLVDATGDPIDPGNLPQDEFEFRGLMQLVDGVPQVQRIQGSDLRTLVPLTNDMHPNCISCHTNFGALPPSSVVGAAALRVGL